MKNRAVMPAWGPYSKKYMGISHIVPEGADIGARFDFTVHPTLWNSSVPVPNVTFPSGYHLWECAADYSYYSYRYDLYEGEKVYADVSFSRINGSAYLARCEFFNNTALGQNCVFNLFASLELPYYSEICLETPGKCVIRNANDYTVFEFAVPRPWDHETPDGMFRGMFRDESFYLGSGLGDRCNHSHVEHLGLKPFGCEEGDRAGFELFAQGFEKPVLAVRYRTVTDGDAVFYAGGKKYVFPASESLVTGYFEFTENPVFISAGAAGIEFDFLAVIEEGEEIAVYSKAREYIPGISETVEGSHRILTLDYGSAAGIYRVSTKAENARLRTIDSGCLEDALVNRLSNGDPTYDRLRETFSRSFKNKRSDTGFFVNPLIKSIFIDPGETHTEYAVVSRGDFAPLDDGEYEKIYLEAKAGAGSVRFNADGEKYELSVNILRATLLTNTVYPVYRRGENIVHHTPGKRWDSFYTWDSGMIGLGLLEFSPELCLYALETYLCDEDNDDFTFLLHGSLVPTQFAEYFELINRAEDKESLDYLYDRMKIYYEFLRGRRAGSTFAKFGNGLLTAYDYWYSCSGMDDYPAQVRMIDNKAEAYSCPCLTTSQVIRAGKIMRSAALASGRTEDVPVYDRDIAESVRALNELAWDEENGYYGYTLYDEDESRPRLMRMPDGENCNRGMDGVYPFVAGAAPEERRNRLIGHIKNPAEMWSAAGVSAVDMSASYYIDDGYWNGNVWMSHQWFLWKSFLDCGDGDFAFEIASRALDIWKSETDFSHYTYECFSIRTLRGGWFHNFGGLSAPVCVWADAYYWPGSVNTGFDVWTDHRFNDGGRAEIAFRYSGESDAYTIIAVMKSGAEYSVTLNGEKADYIMRTGGAVEIKVPGAVREGVIKIETQV